MGEQQLGDLFGGDDRYRLLRWVTPSGFETLDSAAGELRPGELTLVTAAPGGGVSSLLYEIALQTAAGLGRRVLLATASATPDRIARRLLMSASGTPVDIGSKPDLPAELAQRRRQALDRFSETPLTVASAPCDVIGAIGSGRFDLVIVDDVAGHATAEPAGETGRGHGVAIDRRPNSLGQLARHVKTAAMQAHLPVVVGLPSPAANPRQPVRLQHLPTWEVADAADLVVALGPSAENGVVELVALKNRHGQTGALGRLAWIERIAKFCNLDRRDSGWSTLLTDAS